jgi:hypothetical protein
VRTRYIVVVEDAEFLEQVTGKLRAEGHEVTAISDPAYDVPPPRASDCLEVTVTRSAANPPGLRMRVTGLPSGEPYAGVLGSFLAEPVSVAALVKALGLFNL